MLLLVVEFTCASLRRINVGNQLCLVPLCGIVVRVFEAIYLKLKLPKALLFLEISLR